MVKPVHIFVDGQELVGYTSLSLTRKKKDLTGSAKVDIFMGYMPNEPIVASAVAGAEMLIYIGGHLAFTGDIDRRGDEGKNTEGGGADQGVGGTATGDGENKKGSGPSITIGPNQYSVSISARGKARELIDSSHQNKDGYYKDTPLEDICTDLCKDWDVDLDWRADNPTVKRHRLRDGARVVDELHRLGEQYGLYIWEGLDGKLIVCDGPCGDGGEAIILGRNILQFSGEIWGDQERQRIKVKGQRVQPEDWGEDALLETELELEDDSISSSASVCVIQHYGDATEEELDKRANYEASKRNSESKKIQVEVFHVLQASGDPWDIGVEHYVSIPPAGVSDTFEVTELTYEVKPDKTLKTKLTLSPPPTSAGSGGAAGVTDLGGLGGVVETPAGAQLPISGLNSEDLFHTRWFGPRLVKYEPPELDEVEEYGLGAVAENPAKARVLKLPSTFKGADET